jgi:MOSC domain-containing protein YiiM
MQVVSLNVGLPREVPWRGRSVRTGIFKEPVGRRLRLERLNLEGDGQADPSVHGGVHKAVYAYPSEHYPFWSRELGLSGLPWGAFGENLTTAGLAEDRLRIGDRLRLGSAELVVSQPRTPCFKLGVRFGRPDLVKRFQRSRRSGCYFAVAREGEVGAGDALELVEREPESLTVAEVLRAYAEPDDAELLRRASELSALPEAWRRRFRERLAALGFRVRS